MLRHQVGNVEASATVAAVARVPADEADGDLAESDEAGGTFIRTRE